MNARAFLSIKTCNGIDYGKGLLSGSRIIQVYQRFTVNMLPENGKSVPYFINLVRDTQCYGGPIGVCYHELFPNQFRIKILQISIKLQVAG